MKTPYEGGDSEKGETETQREENKDAKGGQRFPKGTEKKAATQKAP